jgi:3-oxoacid CoA-transferase
MATRRISAACLASTGRNALLAAVPRTRQHFVPRFQCLRQLQTTAIRYEQQQANTKAKGDPAPKIVRGRSKVYKNADEAVADLKSGSTILSAGFGLCGTAGNHPPYNSFQ